MGVDPRSITLAASELFEQGHYPGVVAVCTDALASVADHIELRILLARALIALRQDALARRQLGLILQQDPNSSIAFELLGEIAFRADDLGSAEIYFRESTRLNAYNEGAQIWLDLVESMNRVDDLPLVLKPKHPRPTTERRYSAQHNSSLQRPRRRRFPKGTEPQVASPYRDAGESASQLRERPSRQRSRAGSIDVANPDRPSTRSGCFDVMPVSGLDDQTRAGDSTRVGRLGSRAGSANRRAASSPGAARLSSQQLASAPAPTPGQPAPGRFGSYLVDMGLLSAEQLGSALRHHQVSKMRVGEAAVVLGFISQQKLDWAALGFHCRRD